MFSWRCNPLSPSTPYKKKLWCKNSFISSEQMSLHSITFCPTVAKRVYPRTYTGIIQPNMMFSTMMLLPASYHFYVKNFPDPVWFSCWITLNRFFLKNFPQFHLQIRQTFSIHSTAPLTCARIQLIFLSLYFSPLQMRGLNSLSPLLHDGYDFISLRFTDSGSPLYRFAHFC